MTSGFSQRQSQLQYFPKWKQCFGSETFFIRFGSGSSVCFRDLIVLDTDTDPIRIRILSVTR
jgi:hypothetical protein